MDECLPQDLRKHLPRHDVVTVGCLNWTGITNGALLKAAEAEGFELLLTGDKGLAYQNDLGGGRIAVIALSAVSWKILRHPPEIAMAVDEAEPRSFRALECGAFVKPRREWRTTCTF